MYKITRMFTEPTPIFSWILLTLGVSFLFFFIYKLLLQFFNIKEKKNVILLLATIFVCILFLETALRITKSLQTYGEQRTGTYNFVHHGSFTDSFHVHYPNSTFLLGNGIEFQYPRTANSEGFTDLNWTRENPNNSTKILCLGDSFTEGDGAPADSTWPILLNQLLIKQNINSQVLNAGICGSDPLFELMLFNERLVSLDPDIVIFTLSMQDFFEDIAVRGGMERFDPETGTKTKIIEVLYAYSHITRWVMKNQGYNWLLIKNTKELVSDLAKNKVPEVIGEFAKAKQKNPETEFFIFLYPHQYQLQFGYDIDVEEALKKESDKYPELNYYDLNNCYQGKVETAGDPFRSYWWPMDGHHNSKGYYLKARCINEYIFDYLSSSVKEELPSN